MYTTATDTNHHNYCQRMNIYTHIYTLLLVSYKNECLMQAHKQ